MPDPFPEDDGVEGCDVDEQALREIYAHKTQEDLREEYEFWCSISAGWEQSLAFTRDQLRWLNLQMANCEAHLEVLEEFVNKQERPEN